MQQTHSLTHTHKHTRGSVYKNLHTVLLCIFVIELRFWHCAKINLELNVIFYCTTITYFHRFSLCVVTFLCYNKLSLLHIVSQAAAQPVRSENFCCNTQISFLFAARTTIYPEAEKIIKIYATRETSVRFDSVKKNEPILYRYFDS